MAVELKSYPLEGKTGLSDRQIQEHRDTLYKNYVAKLNEINDALPKADPATANGTYGAYRELRAEQTFAHNAVVLHELYFENMGGKGGEPTGKIAELIKKEYGSFEKWQADFRATGTAARGWAVMGYSFRTGQLHNFLLETHHHHVPILVAPLLVMDVYEHAYMIDYGVKRASYLDTFFKTIHWEVVNQRWQHWVEPVLK